MAKETARKICDVSRDTLFTRYVRLNKLSILYVDNKERVMRPRTNQHKTGSRPPQNTKNKPSAF